MAKRKPKGLAAPSWAARTIAHVKAVWAATWAALWGMGPSVWGPPLAMGVLLGLLLGGPMVRPRVAPLVTPWVGGDVEETHKAKPKGTAKSAAAKPKQAAAPSWPW